MLMCEICKFYYTNNKNLFGANSLFIVSNFYIQLLNLKQFYDNSYYHFSAFIT